MEQIFIVTDIETFGPHPNGHSMVSIGSIATRGSGSLVIADDNDPLSYEFSANIEGLKGTRRHAATMRWWNEQPDRVWEKAREHRRPAEVVLPEFLQWLEKLSKKGKLVLTCWSTFDEAFIRTYVMRAIHDVHKKRLEQNLNRHVTQEEVELTAPSPAYGVSAFDLKTMATILTGLEFRKTSDQNNKFPKEWVPEEAHTHIAIEDARREKEIFCSMYNDWQKALKILKEHGCTHVKI